VAQRKEELSSQVGELDETEKVANVPSGTSTPSPSAGDRQGARCRSPTLRPSLRQKFSLADDTEGVVVVEVAADTRSEKGLRPGDLIVEVAQQEVKDPARLPPRSNEARRAAAIRSPLIEPRRRSALVALPHRPGLTREAR